MLTLSGALGRLYLEQKSHLGRQLARRWLQSAIARELDLTETALRTWVRQAEIDAGRGRAGALATEERAMVFLEAGRRLEGFLGDAHAALGDREAVIGRELTKLHEEILRGRLSALRAQVAGATVRGEVAVVIAGAPEGGIAAEAPTDAVDDAIVSALAAGRGVREVADELSARLGRPRRALYRRALELKSR